MAVRDIVIVGAGQAGFQTAASLRQEGFDGHIFLLGDEPHLPYQRPPLSKAYLKDKEGRVERLVFRKEDFFAKNKIELLIGERAAKLERREKRVVLESGRAIGYDHLVLATGSRNRRLPGLEDARYLQLRSAAHADEMRAQFASTRSMVIIGGGFIGLEVACMARAMNIDVVLLEAAPRLLPRVLSAGLSEFLLDAHRKAGVDIQLNARISRITAGQGGSVVVDLESGRRVGADTLLVAVGADPNSELALEAGLPAPNGIAVDAQLLTGDPAISAIGDCAVFPFEQTGASLRLESVQNAVDQGKFVAKRLLGHAGSYSSVPWFWSDQGEKKIQIAGITAGAESAVPVVSADGSSIAVHCFRGGALVGIECVNDPTSFLAVRSALGRPQRPTYENANESDFDARVYAA